MLRGVLPVTLLVLLGCASMEVLTDHDPDVDFSRFRTFAHAPAPPPASPRNRRLAGYDSLAARRVRRAIGDELTAKGLQETQPAEADLIVAFSVDGQPGRTVTGGGNRYWGGGARITTRYVRGTLMIDLFERKTRLHVWQGWASQDLFSEKEAREAEGEAIRKILARYPPTP